MGFGTNNLITVDLNIILEFQSTVAFLVQVPACLFHSNTSWGIPKAMVIHLQAPAITQQ